MTKLIFAILIIILNLNIANAEISKNAANQSICKACPSDESNLSPLVVVEKEIKLTQEKVNDSLAMQQSRLNDLYAQFNLLAYLAVFLGALIAVIVVFFSIKSTSSAVSEAKSEANKIVEDWLKNKGEALLILQLEKVIASQLEKALKEIKDASIPILVALDEELQKTTKINQELSAKNLKEEGYPEDTIREDSSSQNEAIVETAAIIEPQIVEDTPANLTPKAQFRRAQKFIRNDRIAEAIVILESLIDQLENSSLETEIILYIEAKSNLARLLESKLNQFDQAISIYISLVARFLQTESGKIASVLIRAINDMCYLYEDVSDYEKAIEGYATAIDLFDRVKPEGSLVANRYARAYSGKARCHYMLEQYQAVIDTYSKFTSKPDVPRSVMLQNLTVRAARSFLNMGKIAEAKEILMSEISITVDGASNKINHPREKILLAQIFEDENNLDEALSLCNQVIEEYNNNPPRMMAAYVMQALTAKASILSKKGFIFEELKTYDQIENLWQESGINKESFSSYTATALVNKAITLSKSGNTSEALGVVNKVIELFKVSLNPNILEQTTKAARLKELLER